MKNWKRHRPLIITAKNVYLFNQIFKGRRRLALKSLKEKLLVKFSVNKKVIDSVSAFVVCIDEQLFFNITLENEFLKKTFGDYCSKEEILNLPDILAHIAINIAAEPLLDNIEMEYKCKCNIEKLNGKHEFLIGEEIEIQYELLRESDMSTFYGSIETNYVGLLWLAEKYNELHKVYNTYNNRMIPVFADIEMGYANLSINEMKEIEVNDIVLINDKLSTEKSQVYIRIGSTIIFDGRIEQSGKITIEQVAIQRMKDVMKQKEKKHIQNIETLFGSITVNLAFKIGEAQLSFSELTDLQPGYTFELDNRLEKPVEIIANGMTFGSGELVAVGDRLGVRVLEFENNKLTQKQ